MNEFKRYKRTNVTELRPVTDAERDYNHEEGEYSKEYLDLVNSVRLRSENLEDGEIKISVEDMVARNPENHKDMWLVSEKDFNDNFKLIPGQYDPIG